MQSGTQATRGPEQTRTLVSPTLAFLALSLFALGVLATRTLSIDTWNSGSSQVGRWVETTLLLVCGALGLTRVSCGERTLMTATVALQMLCLVSAYIYVSMAGYSDGWRHIPLSLHCAALATGTLACLLRMSRLTVRHVLTLVPAAFAIANLANAVLCVPGDRSTAKALSSACLILSMALLYASYRTGNRKIERISTPAVPRMSWREHAPYLVGVIVLSSIYGMLAQLGSKSADLSLTSQSVLLARSAGLAVLTLLCWYRAGAWITERSFVTFVPIVSTFVLALPLANQIESPAYQMLFRVASVVFQAMVWCFSLSAARRHAESAVAVFGLVTGCQHLFMLLGRQAGAALVDAQADLMRIALGTVWLLGIALFLWYRITARRASAPPRPAPPRKAGSTCEPNRKATLTNVRAPSDPVRRAALRWGLSPREEEVARHLAAGADRAAIASDMDVTEETVKTYLRRIYRKAEVHSKRELVCAIADEDPNPAAPSDAGGPPEPLPRTSSL